MSFKIEWAMPCLMIAASVGACVVYVWLGDWRRAMYWAAAAVITASVTF